MPDPDDNHVLAAAICSEASIIVTKNIRDFPQSKTEEWSITAKHPDEFLAELAAANTSTLVEIINDITATWKSAEATPAKVLDSLSVEAPKTAEIVRRSMEP